MKIKAKFWIEINGEAQQMANKEGVPLHTHVIEIQTIVDYTR